MTAINANLLPPSFFKPGTTELQVDPELALKVQAGIQAKLASLLPEVRDEFQQMVNNLAPSDLDSDLKLGVTLGMFEAAASKLNNASGEVVAFVGNLSRFLARIMIEQASEQRQNALNDRLNAREQAKGELLNQAGQMDKAAAKMIEGATTALITGLVAAGLQVLASTISLVGSIKSFNAMGAAQQQTQKAMDDAVGKVMDEAAKKALDQSLAATKQIFDTAQALGGVFTAVGQLGSAAGQGINAAGTSTDSKAQAEAKKMEAEGSRDAAEAQESQQVADNKKQMEEALNDMIKQVINFLKELREAEVDAMRSLTKV